MPTYSACLWIIGRTRLWRSTIWELRDNLSSCDAGYVALAEAIDAPLVTLDVRLAQAPGLACAIEFPG